MPASQRVLFACASAERLMPVYRWYCNEVRRADFEVVRQAFDAVWSAATSGSPSSVGNIINLCESVEALVPDADDELLTPRVSVAQNAVACVAYALRTCESNDPRPSVWCARQLYEAADSVVQESASSHSYIGDIEREPAVRLMVQGIEATLDDVDAIDAARLRAKAAADGQKFLIYAGGST
ncbi:MAG: DUF416 family protein [Acidimicrobiales bacterium]